MTTQNLIAATLVWILVGPLDAAAAPPEAEVKAPPTRDDAALLWAHLGRYRHSYLRTWSDALAGPPASALEVVEAWGEVAVAVAGPAGFWRRTVPDRWLGCAGARADGEKPSLPCARLASAVPELRKWDRLRRRMARLGRRGSARFLKRHRAELIAFLATWVPDEPSASAMERTPFFARRLSETLR